MCSLGLHVSVLVQHCCPLMGSSVVSRNAHYSMARDGGGLQASVRVQLASCMNLWKFGKRGVQGLCCHRCNTQVSVMEEFGGSSNVA